MHQQPKVNMKSCCCCIDLKTGGFILSAVASIFYLYQAFTSLGNGFTIVIFIILAMFAALSIYGIHQNKPGLVLPHIIANWIVTVVVILAFSILSLTLLVSDFGIRSLSMQFSQIPALALANQSMGGIMYQTHVTMFFMWLLCVFIPGFWLYCTIMMQSVYNHIKNASSPTIFANQGMQTIFVAPQTVPGHFQPPPQLPPQMMPPQIMPSQMLPPQHVAQQPQVYPVTTKQSTY